MDVLSLLQMASTLAAIVATIAGAEMVVRKTKPGQRWPAGVLVGAMLTALVFLPMALGIASSLGHAPPAGVTRLLVIGPMMAVAVAGVALRVRYARR